MHTEHSALCILLLLKPVLDQNNSQMIDVRIGINIYFPTQCTIYGTSFGFLIDQLEEWKVVWRIVRKTWTLSHYLQLSHKFEHVVSYLPTHMLYACRPHVGTHRAMALNGNTNKAKSEGKSGPV